MPEMEEIGELIRVKDEQGTLERRWFGERYIKGS
jgi:hypothetical protein